MKKRFTLMILSMVMVALLILTSCMFRELREELEEQQISFRLYGTIENIGQAKSDVWVLLYAEKDGSMQLERYILPDDYGTYVFLITPGTYMVAGFEDQNNNRRHDPGEPVGAWGAPDRIVLAGNFEAESDKRVMADFNFKLTPGPFPLDNVVASVQNNANMASSLIKLGQPAAWEDPAFDQENADTGFWKPITFLKQHGAGIYFMEPYDADKIPVLFVHGSSGTPRLWKALAQSLDSQRFQTWVYYYPSGMRLDVLSSTLDKIVVQLQSDHGFDRMGVVAHSMGGLVSRSFILKHMGEGGRGTVKVFVSFSTPWGGIAMATKGVEHAPEAVPSWYDVQPESEFLEKLYADSLKPSVPCYLLFGYRARLSVIMGSNDGTVEVSSQLDMRAQDDAVLVRGFNEDHMSILESSKAAVYLNKALESAF